MNDHMKLSEILMDELPEEHPWKGNIKGLVERLIANGVTIAKDNNVHSKWIPVTERLPEVARRAIVTDGENISLGYVLNYERKDWNPWCTQYPVIYDKVTHWMPLPTAPEENK